VAGGLIPRRTKDTRRKSRKLEIAMARKLYMGSLIGHPLHLSVFPVEWWEEQFAGYDVLYRNHDGDTPFPYATFYVQAKERA
jgi:hypothetical protein